MIRLFMFGIIAVIVLLIGVVVIFPLLLASLFLLLVIVAVLLAIGTAIHHLMKATPPVSNRNPKIKVREVK